MFKVLNTYTKLCHANAYSMSSIFSILQLDAKWAWSYESFGSSSQMMRILKGHSCTLRKATVHYHPWDQAPHFFLKNFDGPQVISHVNLPQVTV